MNKAKVANIDGLTKPELDYLCEHDYIKVGEKYYISKERATELVAKLQANGVDTEHDKCHIQRVSESYYYLKNGDEIEVGDEYREEDGTWHKTGQIGKKFNSSRHYKHRRIVNSR